MLTRVMELDKIFLIEPAVLNLDVILGDFAEPEHTRASKGREAIQVRV